MAVSARSLETPGDDPRREWHGLKREIDRQGWGRAASRQLAAITRPHLKAEPGLMSKSAPPKIDAELRLRDLVRLEVEFPILPDDVEIPDEWLAGVIRELRKNLEFAVRLCEEVGDMHRFHISPIVPDERPDISDYGRSHGLSGAVIRFASLFGRLIELDLSRARREFSAWPTDDETAFSRLRIWAGGKPRLTTALQFFQIVKELTDDAFWSEDHQRDLLLVLAERWDKLPQRSRQQIEARLLEGPPQWDGEEDEAYEERRAWATLVRLRWLADNRCRFSFGVEEEISKRHQAAPRWKPEHAKSAADSREMRSGWVRTNTEHAALLREPIETILSNARELSGRTEGDTLEERDPFAGVCVQRPTRAYLALARAARQNDYPEWAWTTFLESAARKNDRIRLLAAVAERLYRFPDAALGRLLYPSTWWLKEISKVLSNEYPASLDKVTSRLIDLLYRKPSEARSAVMATSRGRDWVTEALNSPAGHIAHAILDDSRVEAIHSDVDASAGLLCQLARLLAVTGDPRRHAIAIVTHHLGWFHRFLPEWTEHHLLSILDADDDEDREALWAGFFWNPRVTSATLYLRLKPAVLTLVSERGASREGHVQSLASLTLLGWKSTNPANDERLVSDAEFRDAVLHGGDEFRSQVLWQIQVGINDREESGRRQWSVRAVDFFEHVWPRQRSVKNSSMSIRLCELLLASTESFPDLIDAVLPLLTKITGGIGLHLNVQNEVSRIIDKCPERLLTLLDVVLSDDVADWPYGIGDVLEKIGAADNNLLLDERFQGLNRKWSAR